MSLISGNSFKMSKAKQFFIKKNCSAVEPLQNLLDDFSADRANFATRSESILALGLFLREHGSRWEEISLITCAVNYCDTSADHEIDHSLLSDIMATLQALNEDIERMGLNNIHEIKHLLSFNELSQLYGVSKLGKLVKPLLDELIRWQILNLQATKEEAMAFMLSQKAVFIAKYQA